MAELSRYNNGIPFTLKEIMEERKFRAGPNMILVKVIEREKMSETIEIVRNLDPQMEQRRGMVVDVGMKVFENGLLELAPRDKIIFMFRPTQKWGATWITKDEHTITAIPLEMVITRYIDDDNSDSNS